jgi:hypothetical protein
MLLWSASHQMHMLPMTKRRERGPRPERPPCTPQDIQKSCSAVAGAEAGAAGGRQGQMGPSPLCLLGSISANSGPRAAGANTHTHTHTHSVLRQQHIRPLLSNLCLANKHLPSPSLPSNNTLTNGNKHGYTACGMGCKTVSTTPHTHTHTHTRTSLNGSGS